MTVALVGSPTYGWAWGDVTNTVPAGWQSGDLLLSFCVGDSVNQFNDIAGWSTVFADTAGQSGNYVAYKIRQRVANSEPASYVFTRSTGDKSAAAMMIVRGQKTTAPITVYAVTKQSLTAPSVNTPAANCLVLRCMFCAPSGHTHTFPAGVTAFADYSAPGWPQANIGVGYHLQAVAGATGTAVMTTSDSWGSLNTATIVIEPPGVAFVPPLRVVVC